MSEQKVKIKEVISHRYWDLKEGVIDLGLIRDYWGHLYLTAVISQDDKEKSYETISVDQNPELMDLWDFNRKEWNQVEVHQFMNWIEDVQH